MTLDEAKYVLLTTYRRDGTALSSPVWFRVADDVLEVVIANGDVKLKHLARHRDCSLTIFEAVPPFRGVEVRGSPELLVGDVTAARAAIAGRYLAPEVAGRFVAQRDPTATLLRIGLAGARCWDLSAILPSHRTGPDATNALQG